MPPTHLGVVARDIPLDDLKSVPGGKGGRADDDRTAHPMAARVEQGAIRAGGARAAGFPPAQTHSHSYRANALRPP